MGNIVLTRKVTKLEKIQIFKFTNYLELVLRYGNHTRESSIAFYKRLTSY